MGRREGGPASASNRKINPRSSSTGRQGYEMTMCTGIFRFFALVVGCASACSADTGELTDAPLFCQVESARGLRLVGDELLFGDGCNNGLCVCEAGECANPPTTAAGCSGPPQRASDLFPRCRSHRDCGNDGSTPKYNVCIFDAGCDDPLGHCVQVQSLCAELVPRGPSPDDHVVYCGCDGTTYGGWCPLTPYRHSGPCR